MQQHQLTRGMDDDDDDNNNNIIIIIIIYLFIIIPEIHQSGYRTCQ